MEIAAAKLRILKRSPFFGTLLYTLPVEFVEDMPTLGVDGERLYVNQAYWDKLAPLEQEAVLMHETGHLFLGHTFRGRNYNAVVGDPQTGHSIRLYNLAGDAVINLMIQEDGVGKLPAGCFMDPKYKGMATEEVYWDLEKNTPKMTPEQQKRFMENAAKNGWCDQSRWGKNPDGTPQDKAQRELAEKKWGQKVKAAGEYARQKGKEPAWLKRLFKLQEPKEDWRQLLIEYAQPFNNDYSFNPADRRYLEEDFSLPDIQDGEKIDWVAIAIDTSGSIGGKEIDAFVSEVKGIMESFDKVKVRITFCDAAATPLQELEGFDPALLNVKGGGGTDFRPVFDLVAKEDMPPQALLYFTDGMGMFPKEGPGYDVLWVLTAKCDTPFGKDLPYKV